MKLQNTGAKWFLLGMPGCGKTRLLEQIDSRLRIKTVDLDKSIEEYLGMSISSYFNFYGEAAFRVVERKILLRQVAAEIQIYACGGGTPVHFDNMACLKEYGRTIYLHCSIPRLVRRLSVDKTRPHFHNMSPLEIELKLSKIYLQRKGYYEQADFTINVDENEQTVVDRVVEIIF